MTHKMLTILLAIASLVSCNLSPQAEEALPAPRDLKVETVSPRIAKLSWTAESEGVKGWYVYMRTEKDAFHVQPVNYDSPLPQEARSYEFKGLMPGNWYDFGVQALSVNTAHHSAIVYAERYTVESLVEESPDPSEEPVESEDPSGDASEDPSEEPGVESAITVKVDLSAMKVDFSGESLSGEELAITLAPVSANNTVQIDKYSIGNESFTSYTDWVGPYNMRTVAATSQTDKSWGFTGGWHGSNGDATGDPTAQTQSIAVSVDGESVGDGSHEGKEAVCVVSNKVEAANTKFAESKRFVLDETVTYTFKEGRLYVQVDIAALEDVNIMIYYGMQIGNGFCSKFAFKTDDDKVSESAETFYAAGKVRDMIGYSAGGHQVTAHMYDEGLGDFSKATSAYSAFTQFYGAGNGKGYYMLIGDMNASQKTLRLGAGESVYWRGYYEFNTAE